MHLKLLSTSLLGASVAIVFSRMARTKALVLEDRAARDRAAGASARRSAGLVKAARILSTQEVEALQPVRQPARAPSEDEDSETEPEDDTFTTPESRHVIKLSAQVCGSGGRFQWRGRLRGGGRTVFLKGTWVRKNFKA